MDVWREIRFDRSFVRSIRFVPTVHFRSLANCSPLGSGSVLSLFTIRSPLLCRGGAAAAASYAGPARAAATCKRLLMRVNHVATRYNDPPRGQALLLSLLLSSNGEKIYPSSLVITRRSLAAREQSRAGDRLGWWSRKALHGRSNIFREIQEAEGAGVFREASTRTPAGGGIEERPRDLRIFREIREISRGW